MIKGKNIQDNPEFDKNDFWKARSELAMSINNASIDGMMALDTKLNIISCNAVIETWANCRCSDLIGKAFFEVFPLAMNVGFKDAFNHALKGRNFFLSSESGCYFKGHFETHVVPLKDNSGKIYGILQIIHDVAHRVKGENQLRELNEQLLIQYTELKHANEEMATFAKIAAHDLMEPVRKIYLFAEQIKKNEAVNLTDSGKGNIRRIQTNLQRLGLLMDDIVSFLTISTMRREMEKADLSSILSKVLDDLKNEIGETGIMISYEELPVINGDSYALEQIFRQLISNALKFRSRDTPPKLVIDCKKIKGEDTLSDEARKKEIYYCLSFRDNGIGFESGYSLRVFELFQQLHPHGAYKGSGKGLAIALKAARLHKGFMKAESEPGKGSVFYCYLPV